MKMLKRVFAVICSLTMLTALSVNVSADDYGTNPISLAIVDNTETDNTVDVNFKLNLDTFNGCKLSLKIPTELQSYITGWEYSTPWDGTPEINTVTQPTGYAKGSNTGEQVYLTGQISPTSSSGLTIPSDKVVMTLKLTLVEGGIPASVSAENRTITVGGDYKSGSKKTGASLVTVGTTSYYVYRTDGDSVKASNFITYDPTATGCYVEVPTAKANDPVTATVVGDTHVGDKETEGDEADTTDKAVAILGTPAAPESQATSLVWTVTDKSDVTQTFTQAVNVEGGATYKFGLVLRNITADLIKTVSAAFAQ